MELPDLHDGFFDGVLLSATKCARLFVRSADGRRSTIRLTDVEALNLRNVRDGNILFEVLFVGTSKLSPAHIEQVYELNSGAREDVQRLLTQAQRRGLCALEINPSYGAEGVVLFRTGDVVPGYLFE
jgi:hypothetical protein